MKILFRCNAGKRHGLGHLVRCKALAKEFYELGHEFFFLIKSDSRDKIIRFLYDDINVFDTVLILSDNISVEDDIKIVKEYYNKGFSFLILDHYEHDISYQQSLVKDGIRWGQFDYSADKKIEADVVINGNIAITKEKYKSITKSDAKLCVGFRYAILPKEIAEAVAQPQKGRILIAMGGGNYPQSIIDIIVDIVKDSSFTFDIVSNDNRLYELMQQVTNVHFHINLKETAFVYGRCECAIVAGGVTTFEIAALNIPMIIIPYVQNQKPNALAWEKMFFGITCDNILKFSQELQQKGLNYFINLVNDIAAKKQIRIDGRGAKRVVENIVTLLNK
ncbi:hypothetical protein QA597_11695 [Marinilabiliaceae bacterium ANBcel2]|nr:hypothetical protein [Marinilabiliaceae bacterium ANBcel2]